MYEVYDVTRRAYNELCALGVLNDGGAVGDCYVVVACRPRFGTSPARYERVDTFDTSYWACRVAERMEDISTGNALVSPLYVRAYEVWHVTGADDGEGCAELSIIADGPDCDFFGMSAHGMLWDSCMLCDACGTCEMRWTVYPCVDYYELCMLMKRAAAKGYDVTLTRYGMGVC